MKNVLIKGNSFVKGAFPAGGSTSRRVDEYCKNQQRKGVFSNSRQKRAKAGGKKKTWLDKIGKNGGSCEKKRPVNKKEEGPRGN